MKPLLDPCKNWLVYALRTMDLCVEVEVVAARADNFLWDVL